MSSLERHLKLPSVVAISVSTMLGSGIFVLPGLAAGQTGPSVWLAYLAAGLCVLPAALSKSELGTAMPVSGGTYVYIDRAFGPLAGTIAGIGLWLSLLLKSAFALVGFSAYLAVLGDFSLEGTALALLVGIVALNIVGVIRVSQVQMFVVGVGILCMIALVAVGVFSSEYDGSRLEPLFPEGGGGFFGAAGFVFVSYAGVTKVAAIAEEVQQPERNLPAGMLISLFLAMALYVGVSLVLVACIPLDQLGSDLAPVYTLGRTLLGPTVGVAAAVLGIITMTSMANAGLLSSSRFPFAMSRDDLLPGVLSQLHARYRTPTVSIVVSGGIMAAVILLFEVVHIAKLASSFVILLYVIESLTVLVLRETGVQWYRPTYRSPGYPWMQIFGILAGLLLLAGMGPLAVAAVGAIALPGVLLFFFYGRRRTGRRGVVRQRGRRTELLRDDPDTGEDAAAQEEPSGEAAIVVALFGREYSPEMLVELAEALADGDRIIVVHLTEIPEQTSLEAFEEEPQTSSIRRRILAMADSRGLDLEFFSLASRDIVRTVAKVTRAAGCRWLVIEWAGRRRFAFTIRDPLGWFTDHLPCNLAVFSDAGVRYIREILAHVAPGPHDALAVGTAARLAEVHQASLTFARFLPTSATSSQAQAGASYLEQVRQLLESPSEALLLRGGGEVEALGEASASYDLLITVGAPRGTLLSRIRGRYLDRLTERAACSVLRLQAPQGRQAVFERYRPKAPPKADDLMSFVHPRCLGANLAARKKESVFEQFAGIFAEAMPELDRQDIIAALWEREETQNTALGEGIALPHATLPGAGRTHLGVFTTRGAIDYHAPDGGPVDVYFVTLGTAGDRQAHLVLLAEIAKLASGTDAIERLRAAEDDRELLEILDRATREISGTP